MKNVIIIICTIALGILIGSALLSDLGGAANGVIDDAVVDINAL